MEPESRLKPKSIHTYLDTDRTQILGYEVDVRITAFTEPFDPDWLYYFSLSVPFTEDGEWAHGGFQRASEFKSNGNKGVNWGGEHKNAISIGRTNTPFSWETTKWVFPG